MIYSLKETKDKIKNTDILFFDLDGTLIDTEKLYFRFWKEASKYYGFELSDEVALSLRSRERISAKEIMSKASNGILDYDQVREKRVELMNDYFLTHPIKIKPYAIELLKKYKKENKKIYIVTANTVDKAKNIISSLGFIDLIDDIISAKDVSRGKPFPDVYVYAAKKVGVKPKDVVVYEDSPNGLISSHEAGCFTIMVEDLTKYEENMHYVDAYVSSFKELL